MNASPQADSTEPQIAYKIAVLVYIWNDAGELLLLHRKKPPNQDLYSPIGGKLEQSLGESPHACALREIEEEISVRLTLDDIRLLGIVSERAYGGGANPSKSHNAAAPPSAAHWLMFCFHVNRPLNFPPRQMSEGRLEWHHPSQIAALPIPKTDREVIWPLVQKYAHIPGASRPSTRPSADLFCVHIDCTDAENFNVIHEHPLLET